MMAVVVDRADLLFAEISQGLKPVRDVLVVAGLFYLSKKLVGITHVKYLLPLPLPPLQIAREL